MQTVVKTGYISASEFEQDGLYRRYFKRYLDFILSLIAIIVLSPVLLAVAILVRIKIGSPVIFRQERPGLDEKIFTLYKFRTMTDERDEIGRLLPDKMRITGLGGFLRCTSLDELPELFNILKGDMSIIGPRPLLTRYLPYYTETEKCRHKVRPGLTGLAQINGRNNLEWDRRLALDVEYVRSMSLLLDIRILYKTVIKVLKREDVAIEQGSMENLDIERRERVGNHKVTV